MLENYFVEPASRATWWAAVWNINSFHRGNFVSNSRVAIGNATGDNDRSSRAKARHGSPQSQITTAVRPRQQQNQLQFYDYVLLLLHTQTHMRTLFQLNFFIEAILSNKKDLLHNPQMGRAKLSGSLRLRRAGDKLNTKISSRKAGRLISDITIDKSRNNSWLTDCP